MPEGPEVRRHAEAVAAVAERRPVVELSARTKAARAWLAEHPGALEGRTVLSVRSRGKHLVARIEGGYYFHSHLMMWGRWEVAGGAPPAERDRRERARLVVPGGVAILLSAPIFEVGEGDPFEDVEQLRTLGPDVLPYPDEGPFDRDEFLRRLLSPMNARREVGALLLDQRVAAGVGNYLRAEILFECRIDPWRAAGALSEAELACFAEAVPAVSRRAHETGGVTVPDAHRDRMRADPSLVYVSGREYGTRHHVFRRTNLPCLECGDVVRQLRQTTHADEEGERTRITYFCPTCQGTSVELKRPRRRAS